MSVGERFRCFLFAMASCFIFGAWITATDKELMIWGLLTNIMLSVWFLLVVKRFMADNDNINKLKERFGDKNVKIFLFLFFVFLMVSSFVAGAFLVSSVSRVFI